MTRAGTGKTYASAFALREINPKRALFLVHREQIAKQAIKSYKDVFMNTKTFGLISGTAKDFEADYLFATMQTMSKIEILHKFSDNEFDAIIIDEVHRAGASSYKRILDYFKPKFWLGMSASPERTDGFDVYELFDHNIAYEIRLQQALEEHLLCPFHYFGITDLEMGGQIFNDNSGVRNFSRLVSDNRVDYVIQKAEYYGYSGNRVKGLVFCSRKDEAKELSNKFNLKGYKTTYLSGEDNQVKREESIEKLVTDNTDDYFDYIFTVDIFNEGVDIPEVNQVIMLRPTESPIVFIQQLGRGLRKNDDKEFVIILDFIGNYMNNFMIPMALSGDRTYNKDTIRKYVLEGSRVIPGSSTIHFDEISKQRIFSSIDQIKGLKRIIKDSYYNLKNKLGRVPTLVDFYKNGEVDPILILDEYKTYYNFLNEVEKNNTTELLSRECTILEYLSRIIAKGKRPHEIELLSALREKEAISYEDILKLIRENYFLNLNIEDINSSIDVLNGKFVSNENESNRYSVMKMVEVDSEFKSIKRLRFLYDLIGNNAFSLHLRDIIHLGKIRYNDIYLNKPSISGFVLHEKYSRRDVCHILNWGRDISSTMYGMKRMNDNVTIFVTYHKVETADEQLYLDGKPDYADEFINTQVFAWESQLGRGVNSTYIRDVLEAKNKHLFVKKSDAEGTDFYYMGTFDIIDAIGSKKLDKNGKERSIAKVKFAMHIPVREDLYDYLREV